MKNQRKYQIRNRLRMQPERGPTKSCTVSVQSPFGGRRSTSRPAGERQGQGDGVNLGASTLAEPRRRSGRAIGMTRLTLASLVVGMATFGVASIPAQVANAAQLPASAASASPYI